MRSVPMMVALAVAVLTGAARPAAAQQLPKPGPEFDILKRMEGNWDATVRFGDQESKAAVTYKMACGGLWLTSDFKGSFGGQPFQGRGLDTYDAGKKKYVSVWVDSMATTPMLMEGTYDAGKKTLTMTGDYLGMDGKLVKHKTVSVFKDDDTIEWTMATVVADGQDKPVMAISYKRKGTR